MGDLIRAELCWDCFYKRRKKFNKENLSDNKIMKRYFGDGKENPYRTIRCKQCLTDYKYQYKHIDCDKAELNGNKKYWQEVEIFTL